MLVMVTHEEVCATKTSALHDFVDITDRVQEVVATSGIIGGRATVFTRADLCPLLVNERESGLLKDIRRAVERVSGNGSMHPPSTIGSKSVVFPVVDGRLRLGTWQRLLLFELEGAAEREIVVQVVGEGG